jgi:GNAT superfamily N-acetyltransferase
MSSISIRAYLPSDRTACLCIFRSNQPKYFTASEELDFIRWLDALDGTAPDEKGDGEVHYFVAEAGGKIVGCGGWGVRIGADHATLIWGMVDAAYHSQGIGAALTKYRLENFRVAYPTMDITIDTSHHTAPFYERLGFITEKITKDGYEQGLHRYDMRLHA